MLYYNPDTGEFKRLIHTNNRTIGTCGHTNELGYRIIRLNNKRYYAHRLAWFYMTGKQPESYIDHIDGNPSNNVWSNLRLATPKQNTYNKKIPKSNSSGVKGVCWNKNLGKWQAGIKYQYKSIHLGLFDNLEDAAEAVRVKRLELHNEFSNNG